MSAIRRRSASGATTSASLPSRSRFEAACSTDSIGRTTCVHPSAPGGGPAVDSASRSPRPSSAAALGNPQRQSAPASSGAGRRSGPGSRVAGGSRRLVRGRRKPAPSGGECVHVPVDGAEGHLEVRGQLGGGGDAPLLRQQQQQEQRQQSALAHDPATHERRKTGRPNHPRPVYGSSLTHRCPHKRGALHGLSGAPPRPGFTQPRTIHPQVRLGCRQSPLVTHAIPCVWDGQRTSRARIPLQEEVDVMPGGRRRPVEIVVTFTRTSPGTDEEREAVRRARDVWLDGQLQARGQEIERARQDRPGQHQLVAPRGAG